VSTSIRGDRPGHPGSAQALYYLVKRVAKRAGIAGNVHPHTLRHAFADHIARETRDLRTVQALLGHASLGTTEAYLSAPRLDDLANAVRDVRFEGEHTFYPSQLHPANPLEAPTGIEPV